MKHSLYFLSVLLFFVLMGMGGFEGLVTCQGQMLAAVAIAVPILSAKSDDDER